MVQGRIKKSQEEFIQEVNERTDNGFIVTSKYIGANDDVTFKHIQCGFEFNLPAQRFFDTKEKCPYCRNIELEKRRKDVENIFLENGLVIVGEYKRNDVPVEYYCLKHPNSIQQISFKNLIKKKHKPCKECSGKSYTRNKYSLEETKKLFLEKGHILLDNKYVNSNTKMKCVCLKHKDKIQYKTLKELVILNFGCPYCANNKIDIEQIRDFVKNEGYILLSEQYINARKKLAYMCPEGHEFKMSWNCFKIGHRCTECNSSSAEIIIKNYLERFKGLIFDNEYRFDDCRLINPLPFDFAILKEDNTIECLIEFDGKQHFRSIKWFGGEKNFKLTQKRDKVKNNYCLKNNIPLIRIPYWEYKNIVNILNNVLGYYKQIMKPDVDETLVHKFLVNHPDWSHEKYINQAI